MKLIPINIPDKTHTHRHYCMLFDTTFVLHKDPIEKKGIKYEWITVYHNGKKLELENKDYEKLGRYDLIYTDIFDSNQQYDESIDNMFLLYDNAGLNYAHFFFDFFSRCLYFDELIKTNPNLKLGIPEDYYKEEGSSTFIKQWLDLYYQDKNVNIVILTKNKKYKITNLVIPGLLYGFPEPYGDDYLISKIIETTNKVTPINVKANGCYISRQDTIKRGWYHKRDLINELELINKIKSELKYDIIELMDYDLIGKIRIFKSYNNIIQQSSASNISILFSNKTNFNTIITHPKLEGWLTNKITYFSSKSNAPLFVLNNGGTCIEELDDNWVDKNNAPWKLDNIDVLIDVLKQIDKKEI